VKTEVEHSTCFFFNSQGEMVPTQLVEALANKWKISLRTGCFCNPGAFECITSMSTRVMKKAMKDAEGDAAKIHSLLGGFVRISLGIASNFADCYHFYTFCLTFIDNNLSEVIKLSVLRSKRKYNRVISGKKNPVITRKSHNHSPSKDPTSQTSLPVPEPSEPSQEGQTEKLLEVPHLETNLVVTPRKKLLEVPHLETNLVVIPRKSSPRGDSTSQMSPENSGWRVAKAKTREEDSKDFLTTSDRKKVDRFN